MRRKKVIVLILVFLFIVTFTGCQGETTLLKTEEDLTNHVSLEDEENEIIPGWKLHADDKVTLDWYINYSWFSTPWGENLVSKTITEETGIDINFITPMGSEKEKFNALIASDTLPDIITIGWWENQVDEMIQKDMVWALNELADDYDYYFWKVAEPAVLKWNTQSDGNVYYYQNSFYLPEDYEKRDIGSNQTFLVRKDIYEAIGSPDMTTKEGFKEAVRKAVELYPEVNGEPLIPIGAHTFNETGCVSFDQYLQNFLAIPYEKDGALYDRNTDKEYIEWLKVFRELGEEGYLARDIFIDQRTQMEEKIANGRYFCMLYQRTDLEAQQKELYANNPEQIYMAIDGPKNSSGDDYVLPGSGINGWTVNLISKKCSRPDRAIELFSYLMSEHGQKMIFLGVEGITYNMIDGKPVLKEEVQKLLNTNRNEYDRLYGADNAYWMLQNNVMQLEWRQKPLEPIGQLEEWTYPYTIYFNYEINYETDSDAGNIDINIKKLWSEMLPQLLLAKDEQEFDNLMAEYVERREQMGYDICVEDSIKRIKENKRKLGIE